MEPVAVLMNEHRTIERVLDAVERAAAYLVRGGSVRPAFFTEAITFLKGFADGRHHHKEEELLFPALVEAGLPREAGPVAVMLDEHVHGRALIAAMADGARRLADGDAGAARALSEASQAYVELLRDHIMKEDHVLFPMAARMVTGAAATTLAADFSRAQADEAVAELRDRFAVLADDLAREAAALG